MKGAQVLAFLNKFHSSACCEILFQEDMRPWIYDPTVFIGLVILVRPKSPLSQMIKQNTKNCGILGMAV